jgi:hypothetical protein
MRRPVAFAVLALSILTAAACSRGGDQPGPGTTADPPGGRPGQGSSGGNTAATAGRLELLLVDAPNEDAKQIVVTIARVEAHVAGAGGWVTLLDQSRTVDLLSLQGGTFASLGVSSFPAGRVTQIRLELSADGPNHVVTRDNKMHPLEVPSGTEAGIKINAGFDWPPCATGMMTIDFDGKQSLVVRPRGGDGGEDVWQLRPVINLRSVEHDGGKCGGGGPPADPGNGKPDAGDGKGKGNGNGKGKPDAGNGNGKPDDPGGPGKGHGDGGGKPDDPPGRDKPDAAASAGPRACAQVTCPMGAQFCLNGTCHDVTAP